MHKRRYQVFVSSTFKDLQEERKAVIEAIIKMEQIQVMYQQELILLDWIQIIEIIV